tara:strand:- start:189 stop:311 length:123 start_codon:yes stop_codon:yes gene_type:complete
MYFYVILCCGKKQSYLDQYLAFAPDKERNLLSPEKGAIVG